MPQDGVGGALNPVSPPSAALNGQVEPPGLDCRRKSHPIHKTPNFWRPLRPFATSATSLKSATNHAVRRAQYDFSWLPIYLSLIMYFIRGTYIGSFGPHSQIQKNLRTSKTH